MTRSTLYRLVLLGLLPVIALVLYIEGQTYNPALIRFSPSDAGLGREAAFFPDKIGEFNRLGQVRLFSKDNLYEYVDGHAEYFLSAGFIGLAVGEYIRSGAEGAEPEVVADVYDMGKNIQAFGVFANEVGDDAAIVRVGMMGAKTAQGISFVDGKYFVKITTFREGGPVEMFADRIDEAIGPAAGEITLFSRLPAVGEILETRFVKEAYRGLAFATNVIERSYRVGEETFQVSLVSGNEADMKKLLNSYLAFFRDADIPHTTIDKGGQQFYQVMDPYEGNWYLIPGQGTLYGIYGTTDEKILDRLLASMREYSAPRQNIRTD